jgi:hypothetical protein
LPTIDFRFSLSIPSLLALGPRVPMLTTPAPALPFLPIPDISSVTLLFTSICFVARPRKQLVNHFRSILSHFELCGLIRALKQIAIHPPSKSSLTKVDDDGNGHEDNVAKH